MAFTIEFPDDVFPSIEIYADDTIVNSSIGESGEFEKVGTTSELGYDLHDIIE